MAINKKIRIGSNNLFTGSKDFSGDDWINSYHWDKTSTPYNGMTVLRREYDWYGITQDIPVEGGKDYTFSFYLRGDSNADVSIYTDGGSSSLDPDYYDIGHISTSFTRYEITFTANSTGTVRPRIENTSSDSWIEICGLRFERANNIVKDIKIGSSNVLKVCLGNKEM